MASNMSDEKGLLKPEFEFITMILKKLTLELIMARVFIT